MTNKKFGEYVKNARILHGWSQEELGDRLGISKSSVCKIEKGEHAPSIVKADKICKILNISMTIGIKKDSIEKENTNDDNIILQLIDQINELENRVGVLERKENFK